MRTKTLRVVAILFDEVELYDVAAPIAVLTGAGRRWNFRPFEIIPAAKTPGAIATRSQLALSATTALGSLTAADALLVPGGYGARKACDDAELVAALASLGANAELVAGVGWGVALLAHAGLLADGRVSASGDVAARIAGVAPDVRCDASGRVIEEGRAITAAASGLGVELGLAMVAKSFGKKLAAMAQSELGLAPATERIDVILPMDE